MPVDTDLTVNPPQQSGFLANPLGLIEGVVGLKGQMLTQQGQAQSIAIQQQQMNARMKAGQIISNAPPGDFGAMTNALQSDPDVMAWTPDILKSVNEGKQAILGAQSIQLDQNSKAFDLYRSMLPSIMKNPTQQGAKDTISQVLSVVPPQMREQIKPMLSAAATGLLRNTTGDPAKDADIIMNNAMGQVLGSGLDPAKAFAAAGTVPPTLREGPYGPGGAQAVVTAGGIGGQQGQQGPSQAQTSFNTNRGTDMADYRKKLDDTTLMGGQILKTIEPAWEATKLMKPGGGAEFFTKMGEVAQAFGADQSTVDAIANHNLGASQEFQKLMVNSTMGQIVQQLPAMSRLAVTEFNAFRENNPNLNTDPRAIEKIFNFWTNLYKQSHDEQTQMDIYLDKPGSNVTRWPTIWQDIAQKKGYINTNITGTANQSGAKPKERPPIDSFFK